jgi:signal transduction histidine kinase
MIDRSKIAILLVDDEQDIRDVLEIALADIGYKLYLADNGKTALDVFKKNRIDVVITDIKMPVMDGIELLRQVKRIRPATEVLMITGHGDMDLTISSLKYKATDFITKPVNVDVLEISVDKAVEKIVAGQQLEEYTQRLERLILEKTKLASHLSSLGLMMGTLSHNIKGFLTNLDGGLYLARSGMKHSDTPRIEEGLDVLSEAVGRIKKMVMDVLLYSKERELNKKPVAVDKIMDDVEKALAPRLKVSGIAFKRIAGQAPQTLFIDREFMLSALINILDNSVDACLADKKEIVHEIQFEITEKKDEIMIRIADNGCGMTPKTKEKIFDLFFSSKRTKGTGFGLYIANSIVKQHNGSIQVMSIKGKETCFKITLPYESK